MPDNVTYSAPIGVRTYPGTSQLNPKRILLDLEEGRIEVTYFGDNGVRRTVEWTDAAGENATAMIVALNTANLSTKSLKKRINERAVADGKLEVGGTAT